MDNDLKIMLGRVGVNTAAVARKLQSKGRNGNLTLDELRNLSEALRANAETIESIRSTYIERETN